MVEEAVSAVPASELLAVDCPRRKDYQVNQWTGPDPGGGTPSLREAWQLLADGLVVQRLHLHVEEWREVADHTESVPDIGGTLIAPLGQRPARQPSAEAQELLEWAGLGYWWKLPQLHGLERTTDAGIAQQGAAQVVQRLVAQSQVTPWTDAVVVACEAAAWWTGFFAVIRHRGVRHQTLEPNPAPLHAQVLADAARAVAYGVSTRVLGARLRGTHQEGRPSALSGPVSADAALRRAYCEAVAAGIEIERTLPALLDELDELRLVDLVSTAIPWRGQFLKYAGGTGAGQVE